jgi:transcriptional regulator with XRE-family HTH domain
MTRQEGTDQRSYQPVQEHTIGRNLRRLVGMHDLLQREVADYIGLSPQGLWNILNGRSEPRSRTVRDCASAFGVTVEDLFADTGTCLRAAADHYEQAPIRLLAEPVPLANGHRGRAPAPAGRARSRQ